MQWNMNYYSFAPVFPCQWQLWKGCWLLVQPHKLWSLHVSDWVKLRRSANTDERGLGDDRAMDMRSRLPVLKAVVNLWDQAGTCQMFPGVFRHPRLPWSGWEESLQGQTAHPRGRAAGSRPTSEPGLGMLRGWGEDSSTIGFETIGPSIWKR